MSPMGWASVLFLAFAMGLFAWVAWHCLRDEELARRHCGQFVEPEDRCQDRMMLEVQCERRADHSGPCHWGEEP